MKQQFYQVIFKSDDVAIYRNIPKPSKHEFLVVMSDRQSILTDLVIIDEIQL